jgi:uncharacterized Fe-S cluster-containing radical SAM superfamily protein
MKQRIFLFLIIVFSFYSYKNYYNETIDWADQIQKGTSIEMVKKMQPSFVKISWENPLIIENEKLYEIVEIEGNNDILNMQNFLAFSDGKYQGRESKK